MGLSERDRAILQFEGSWWTEPGSKEAGIKARFGISSGYYRQLLNVIVDSEEAERADPLLVRRLRRGRSERRRIRFEGRPSGPVIPAGGPQGGAGGPEGGAGGPEGGAGGRRVR
jgi:hypothetical protein